MIRRERWRRLEATAIALVAAHSYGVGLTLLFFPAWTITLMGWEPSGTLFFTRQAGALHLVVATGYLAEHARTGGVFLLLLAKAAATVFLGSVFLWEHPTWLIPACGVIDALMGLAVWGLHRKVHKRR